MSIHKLTSSKEYALLREEAFYCKSKEDQDYYFKQLMNILINNSEYISFENGIIMYNTEKRNINDYLPDNLKGFDSMPEKNKEYINQLNMVMVKLDENDMVVDKIVKKMNHALKGYSNWIAGIFYDRCIDKTTIRDICKKYELYTEKYYRIVEGLNILIMREFQIIQFPNKQHNQLVDILNAKLENWK